MARLFAFVFLFLSIRCISHAQEVCSPAEQRTAVAEVAQLRQQLRSAKIPEMDMNVPLSVRKQMVQLKNALDNAVNSVLACHDTSTTPAAIETELAHLLNANPPEPPGGSSISNDDPRYKQWLADLSIYGADLRVRVSKLSPNQPLLSVELQFNIACGDDLVLMLFEPQSSRWIEKLRWQAAPYDNISEAFGNFFFSAILPGDSPRGWRIVVAHGMPSCASVWSAYKMDVLAPTAIADKPRIIRHLQHGYNISDGELKMTSNGNTVTLRLDVGTAESLQLVRPGIFRYTLAGDEFQRIGPIATNGRYFVDEWLQMPWDEARRFSDPTALPQLKAAHSPSTRKDGRIDFNADDGYGPVTTCHDNKDHFQIELNGLYYGIQQNGDGYTMLTANSSRPDPRCGGPDLMKKK